MYFCQLPYILTRVHSICYLFHLDFNGKLEFYLAGENLHLLNENVYLDQHTHNKIKIN